VGRGSFQREQTASLEPAFRSCPTQAEAQSSPTGSAKRSGDLQARLRRPAPLPFTPEVSSPRLKPRLRKVSRDSGPPFGLPCREQGIDPSVVPEQVSSKYAGQKPQAHTRASPGGTALRRGQLPILGKTRPEFSNVWKNNAEKFQSLEGILPTSGKTDRKISNVWKKAAGFFQASENGSRNFPVSGKISSNLWQPEPEFFQASEKESVQAQPASSPRETDFCPLTSVLCLAGRVGAPRCGVPSKTHRLTGTMESLQFHAVSSFILHLSHFIFSSWFPPKGPPLPALRLRAAPLFPIDLINALEPSETIWPSG